MKEYCNSRLCLLPGISSSSSNPLPGWRTVYSKSGASCFKPTVHTQHGWRASVTELLQKKDHFLQFFVLDPSAQTVCSPVPRCVYIQSVWIPEYNPSEGFVIEPVSLSLTKQVRGPVFHYGKQFLILLFRWNFTCALLRGTHPAFPCALLLHFQQNHSPASLALTGQPFSRLKPNWAN